MEMSVSLSELKGCAADPGLGCSRKAPASAGMAPNSEETIDEAVLDALHRVHPEGRPDIAKAMIMLFLESAPTALGYLEEGVVMEDPRWLYRGSRILGSGSTSVGATRLSLRCEELQMAALSAPVSDAAARVREIQRLFCEVESALRAWCAGRG